VGLILLGERTGMWEALASADAALTPQEAADRAGVHPRYATEWLRAMAAGGYVERSVQDRYGISEEMAFAMADPDGPAVPGPAGGAGGRCMRRRTGRPVRHRRRLRLA